MAKGVIDLFMIYQFLKRLVTPFEKWEAYETGVIDENGRVIVRKNDRTPEQSKSWGYYDRLVANLKKLLAKVPGGRTRIASFAAALLLIREENIDPDDVETLSERLQHYMEEAKYLSEEMATNVAGSGAIAGIGVGDDGEPGVPPAAHKKHKKKNKEQEKEVGRKVAAMKFEEFVAEARYQKTQDVNGQTFEVDYHTKPTPSQQRVLKDVMVPYVAMYTKDGFDVVLRSEKHIGLDSQFVLFRKKGGRSEMMVDKLISKNGKVKDNK